MTIPTRVALAHDYLTQRGGAERVVLALVRAFPDAPLHTSLYEPSATFPEFADVDVRTLPINSFAPLRRRHRLALPLLAPSFSRLSIDADVVLCSSSGWAHGARTEGRKIVYCYSPARWLYQTDRYLGDAGPVARMGLATLRRPLERWDRRAASSADRYIVISSWVAQEVRRVYGLEAEVIAPPVTIEISGPQQPLARIEPGYVLCVSRLLPYKNVDAVVTAFERLQGERLVIVGDGPDEARLRSLAGKNVDFAGSVDDAQLRWFYANASALVTASYEDFGLTPLEAAAFGRPTAALRFGGFLNTIREGETGILFDQPEPRQIACAVKRLLAEQWNATLLREHAGEFSEERFSSRLHQIVEEELAVAGALQPAMRLGRQHRRART
jgi:glycosyltransferase involved in cell wall biosynthesis